MATKVKPFLNWTQASLDFLLTSDLAVESLWSSFAFNAFDLDPLVQDFKMEH